MKKPKNKPTNKDLVYNIALNKRLIIELDQKLMILESVINKYIEMKKGLGLTNSDIAEITGNSAESIKTVTQKNKQTFLLYH